MENSPTSTMRLYNERNERLYLNVVELGRFIDAAKRAPSRQRLFALTLAYTGARISEARELRYGSLQLDTRVISIRCLKKRNQHIIREVPMPLALVSEFESLSGEDDQLVWQEFGRMIPRITTYRWIKGIMAEAHITGPKACPKGLRHAFGVSAILSDIPLHMLQRWMGHASMRITAIYATVIGREQLELSDRMWCNQCARYSSFSEFTKS